MDEKIDELTEKLMKGQIKLHEVEKFTDGNMATQVRRKYLEKKYGADLKHTSYSTINFADAVNRNIENSIGATQVPLGCAGELKINGENIDGFYPILLATTEGRLVAGMSRGIKVFNAAGGVNTCVAKDGMTRSMILRTSCAREASKLIKWAEGDGFEILSDAFSKTTRHGRLKEVKGYSLGRDVYLRFIAGTGAAMGMNMVTIGAKAAADELIKRAKKELGVKSILISESGNICADKKPAHINVLEGRGVSVIADATIPRRIVLNSFRVEPELIAELNKAKNLYGSVLAGSLAFNANVANILAAMYIAHGQDVAQIVEGSQAITDVSVVNGNLYVSCYLPAIEVGTYGGGTKRETQQEALRLLGLYGDGDDDGSTRVAFAEIVAAACLVSEVNLLAVQAAGELAKSHAQIKRG